jgi:hypothetical protein
MSQSLFNGAFDECNRGTIPVDELKCGAEYLAGKLDALLEEFDIAPRACVTDTDATENADARLLNELKKKAKSPTLHWFPCVSHILNLILKAFFEAESGLFALLKHLTNSLAHSSGFTELCRELGSARTTIATPCDTRWMSQYEMVNRLNDLEVEIRNFVGDTSQTRETVAAGKAVLPILRIFKAALERFEADTFGVMGDVKLTFIGLRAALGEIEIGRAHV